MTKKQQSIYVAAIIGDLLDRSMAITHDYSDSFDLIKFNPDDILIIRDRDLRAISALIFVCVHSLKYKEMEVRYTNKGFKVKFKIN